MKLKNFLISKEFLILILLGTCVFMFFRTNSLRDDIYDLKRQNKQYHNIVDSLNKEIVISNKKIQEEKSKVKEKQSKIDNLSEQIITITYEYEEKMVEIDNFSSNDVHNELVDIFSKNGIK